MVPYMATEFNVEKHATQILQQGNISEEVSDNFLRYFVSNPSSN